MLATGRWELTTDLDAVGCDRARTGAVARRGPGPVVRRAEPGTRGALVLEAWAGSGRTTIRVWGPPATPTAEADAAVEAGAAWVGLRDDPSPLADLAAGDRRIAALAQEVGWWPRLGRLPRVTEAIGRAVPAQLVQSVEAHRSVAQFASATGVAAGDLTAWPTAATIRATPDWTFRRCGMSTRAARSLRAAAVEEPRLVRAAGDWRHFEARITALPGIGAWTSAEARGALGDPDAVSVGDYNLPGLVGHVLAGDRFADDAAMLELLAPFSGQRGRVIRLILMAVSRRVVEPPGRRAPRAPLSAHRYW